MDLSSFRIHRHTFLITLKRSIGRYRNLTNARKRVTYKYHEGRGFIVCRGTRSSTKGFGFMTYYPIPMKKVEFVPVLGQLSITTPPAVAKRTKESVQSSEKKNTISAYDQARTRWLDYLGYRGIDPIDAIDKTVADFLIESYDSGFAPKAISLTLAVVRSDYRKRGLDLTGQITRKTIGNIREKGRSRGRGQAKGAGIEYVHLVSQ